MTSRLFSSRVSGNLVAGALAAGVLALTACSGDDAAADGPGSTLSEENPSSSATAEVPAVTASSSGTVSEPTAGASPAPAASLPSSVAVASTSDIATGLAAPWGMAFAPDGDVLVTERDSGRVVRVSDGNVQALDGPGAEALVDQLDSTSEAGLLGIALHPDDPTWVYVYLTRGDGNAVVRMRLEGDSLSDPEDVLAGIPKARNHDGGRIAFGPDGMLYIATGDAAQPDSAQDPDSLSGTILRVTADGEPVPDNPFGDAGGRDEVWSYGHRNVQGLGWDTAGRLFASEFGQSDADELNLVVPGANYGWPVVEGLLGSPEGTTLGKTVEGFTYPVAQWQPTSAASPSGIAVTDEAVYVAALRGEALFRVPFVTPADAAVGGGIGEPEVLLDGLGRLRDVAVGPDGALYVLTNNTDGRGSPRGGDDRLMRVELRVEY